MSSNTRIDRSPRNPLVDLYGKTSQKWQATVERLGYPAAYAELISKGLDTVETALPATVLDVGTGTGAFTSALIRSRQPIERVDLLEPSAEMLAIAQKRIAQRLSDVTPVLGGIGSADIERARYDIVLCAHVIEHIKDVAGGLAWLKSRLKPGGVILFAISKPHWCTALVRLRWGHKAYAPARVTELLTDAGFSGIDTVPFSKGPPSRTSCGFVARS